jgi:choline monooxygenase
MSDTLREKLAAFDPELPLERARTVPASWYTDPEVAAAERRSVFGGSWQVVGRADQVAEPGSYLTAQVAGEPVLVVRDQGGELRAFFNVCRHRAAPILSEPCGHATKLRCPYHGWTYDLAGRLRGTPEFDGVADFRREDNGLVPVAVAVWGPAVWVHLGRPAQPLEAFLDPLPQRTAGPGFGRLRWAARRSYALACNWKVFVDNFLDGGYHVNAVHPSLAGILDYSQYRTEVFGQTSVQSSPLRPPEAGDDPSAASVRTGERAEYWWVFPNYMLNVYDNVMDSNWVLPLGPERCRVVFDFFFAQTEGADARRFMAESMEVAHKIQLEDAGICEAVQHGLGSRSYDTGRFSVRREVAGYHFHRLLARALRG